MRAQTALMIGWTDAGSELTSWRQTCLAFALAAVGSVEASLQAASSPVFTEAGSGELWNSAWQAATTVAAFGTPTLVDDPDAVVALVVAAALEVCVLLAVLEVVGVETETELPPQPPIATAALNPTSNDRSFGPIVRTP